MVIHSYNRYISAILFSEIFGSTIFILMFIFYITGEYHGITERRFYPGQLHRKV
ncbi:hypothetical protein MsAg5_14630 [Methanosarcinaceae archaeon Ag5]|uniref:Uncharacterized protein n=1 Tax=Methanolapillus africanus TaxID=3028297 RepID=A0AAE4MKF8_9EURY|nr:hypothetical protein [Methanosarcinaceae archaeon Ag5]